MDINFISPINQLGYGIVGLNILKAFSKTNRIALWIIGPGEAHPKEHDTIHNSVNNALFFNKDAPSLRLWHQFDMAMHVGKGLHTGMTIFELDKLNELEIHQLNSLDCIFVNSNWAKTVLEENNVKTKIVVAPLGVDNEMFRPVDANLSSDTTFLNIGKWEIRKGHDILVEAFNKAFNVGDKVKLIMNCYNPFIGESNLQWQKMYLESKMKDNIVMLPRLETQEDVAALMNSVDVGVFPVRAEGWNLEALEMMACGKHIITTNYSGHTEYASKDNSYLIDIDSKEDAYDGVFFKGQGQWAEMGEKQVDQLIEYMRLVHKQKQSGGNMFNQAGYNTSQNFKWDSTIDKILGVLGP